MKNSAKTGLLLVICVLLLTSCAKHIIVSYQTESANTGTIKLQPVKPTDKTFVTIDDNLIVNKKAVKSVTITNVPNGTDYSLQYSSDNGWYKYKLDTTVVVKMDKGKEVTKIVEVPPYSTGYYIYQGVVYASIMAFNIIWLII